MYCNELFVHRLIQALATEGYLNFPFQEKHISDDVHLRTIDILMGGVESIFGGVHRHAMLEVLSYYDKKYIEKCFLHDEAANLLALKSQGLAIKDHYTRLYGPMVTVAKAHSWLLKSEVSDTTNPIQALTPPTEAKGINPTTGIAIQPNFDSKKSLKLAFDSHPYSVYSNKVGHPNYEQAFTSPYAFEDCIEDRKKRTVMLWKKAFSERERMRKYAQVIDNEAEKIDVQDEEVEKIIEVYRKYSRKVPR